MMPGFGVLSLLFPPRGRCVLPSGATGGVKRTGRWLRMEVLYIEDPVNHDIPSHAVASARMLAKRCQGNTRAEY